MSHSHDFFSDRAKHHMPPPCQTVRGDDNDIRAFLFGGAQNLIRGFSLFSQGLNHYMYLEGSPCGMKFKLT